MTLKIFISLVTLFIINASFSQAKWELTKEGNGIKVYTSQENGLKVKSIKVEAVFEGTLQKLQNILMDVPNTKNWVYATKQAYIVKKISPTNIVYYTETSLPWPVSNRDVTINMTFNLDAKNNSLRVFATGDADAVPEKKGIVRVQNFNASYIARQESKNRISIVYTLKMDPAGSFPASVTNMFITKGPYETFNNLGKLLKR